jgi:Flp pilus assembly protein TadG
MTINRSNKNARATLSRDRGLRRSRKGVEIIEFAFVLPAILFILLFAIDMGRNIFVAGSLQDAAYISARTGAQVGGACVGSPGCNTSAAHNVFYQSLGAIPGAVPASAVWKVTSGGTCTLAAADPTNSYVTITVTYPEKLVTPGLATALQIVTGGSPKVTAVGIARCEVVR